MCGYRCPLQERRKCVNFLLCRGIMDEDKDYNLRANALTAACAHQKICPKTKRAENTDDARQCYEYHISNKR